MGRRSHRVPSLFFMGFSLLSAWQARNKKPPAMRVVLKVESRYLLTGTVFDQSPYPLYISHQRN